jgi:hypothetical protein
MSEHSEEHGHALTIPYCKSMDGSAAQRDRGTEAERPSGESKSVTAATTSYIGGGAGCCPCSWVGGGMAFIWGRACTAGKRRV